MAPFRSYDAAIGRWTSMDPIYKFHESGYAAMANNPILYIDPLGLDTIVPGGTLPVVPVYDVRPERANVPNLLPLPTPTVVPSPAPNPPSTGGSAAASAASRFLGIMALMLMPTPLGEGSSMPFYRISDSEPGNNGFAIITHQNVEPYPGHFTIEVNNDGVSIHTEQIIIDDSDNTIIYYTSFFKGDQRAIRIELPNASSAQAYQNSVIGKPMGVYDPRINSCLTHVCNVLQAGGVPVSSSWKEQIVRARKMFEKLY